MLALYNYIGMTNDLHTFLIEEVTMNRHSSIFCEYIEINTCKDYKYYMDMETGDMSHIGLENVLPVLMIHSVSPQARRLTEQLLTDDPYDIDIRLDENSVNRSAQIANVYLKAMGYRLRFTKKLKRPARGILVRGVTYHYADRPLPNGVKYVNKEEKGFNVEKDLKRMQEVESIKRGIYYEGVYYEE